MSQSDQDAMICRAAELADGWDVIDCEFVKAPWLPVCRIRADILEQHELDALAAQLVRQLLAQGFDVHIDIQGSCFDAPGMWVEITDLTYSNTSKFERDARNGYSMNLISSIVEFDSEPA